jgi:hypothetical protein
MIAHGHGQGIWAVVICCTALALAGCGADGTSQVYIPPGSPAPSVSGTLYAPNGQFAAAEHWWRWADLLWSMPRAYAALQSELPVTTGGGENVSLSKLDPVQAAHGSSERALLLANGRTYSDGTYFISNDQLASFQAGEIIVQVGNGAMLTRAFVISCTTDAGVVCTADMDAVSEGVVHVVLDYLAGNTEGTQLSDFSKTDLANIQCMARVLAGNISGTSVADINAKVYTRLAASQTMQVCLQQPGQCRCP